MNFAVHADQGARGREGQGRVVVFLSGREIFGDAAAYQVCFCRAGELGQEGVGGAA